MWQSRVAVVISLCALLNAARATAQPEPARSLSLPEAIGLALQENPQIRVAQSELDYSRAAVTRSRGALLPQLDLSGQYTRNVKKPVIFLPQGFGGAAGGNSVLVVGYDNSYAATLSATAPLFNYSIYTGIHSAAIGRSLAEEALRAARISTVQDVRKAFYDALLARELWRLAQQSLQNAEQNLASTRNLESQGLVSEYDLLRAQVQVDNARPTALQAEDAFQQAQDNLKIAIGLETSRPIEIAGELAAQDTVPTPSPAEAWQALRASNAALRQLDLQVRAARAAIGRQKASFLPTLSAFGNYQYETQSNTFSFSSYKWISTLAVGVQFSVPLFAGLSRVTQLQQARADYRKAVEEQTSGLRSYRAQLESVLFSLTQAKARLRGQQSSIQVAERAYRIAQARYRDGLGTQLEVNDAELALTQARANYLQAAHDYQVAVADYDALVGRAPQGEEAP